MLKAAKIELNMSKFPDSSTQNIDQVNFLRKIIQTKMTIVAITVKITIMK